jgi:nucleotide-binding universal stress UspA family protein
MTNMKRILVATDGSDDAERAVDFAAHLAKTYSAELLIVSVIDVGLPGNFFSRIVDAEQAGLKELFSSEAANRLKKARHRAQYVGPIHVKLESRTGDVAQTILEIARESHADLIVVGKRGNGRLAGLLLGSVSQKLASLAPVPVTIVP